MPELSDPRYHEMIVSAYRAVYRFGAGTVWIVAVLHGRQLLTPERIEPV